MAFANPQSQRASSSSSSISIRGWNYDVFLSFMGEDTRHNFTDHLYRALNRKGIRTFRDDEVLPRGEEIASELLKAIEESRICLIILSENYAREQMGKLVFPIFYLVEPLHVRGQIRSFGEALADHERNAGHEEGRRKIERCRAALTMVAGITGWWLKNRPEAHVIEEITSVIWKSLNQELLHVEKNLVGMDRQSVSSSSSSSSIGPSEYEVFLSFWDEDARHNFIDHLYAALHRKGIRTFRIDDLRGGDIALGLLHAIEKSRLVLVILSDNYVRSSWCSDELVKIMKCRKEMGKIVFPVFHHVGPSHVRTQRGSYGRWMVDHERKGFDEKIQRWGAALREVGYLSGWHVHKG
ncbi:hypothetical protein PVL29_024615 [Vitis rotundifolia]|uniref:ADP-ribosyl cyclase/cyclic ADP-ribose hydrolase n=1 Tax=Vitis rotundifolia TaxID=103349 RepID=A0AA38YSB1_VITRO|nr:hypothetical protein PVL29_024615 [Vitis rotundifolia]